MVPLGEVVAGRYRILRPLANGGMSRVWLASDDRAGVARHVAIKQCTVPDGLSPEQRDVVRQWAFHEARAAARVRHPNLIHTLEVCQDNAGPWIVMEYVPSRSLQEIVETEGSLPPVRVAEIGLAVLAALAAANDAGVLHLDVKPGNVLIGDDGRVVLTDFGPAVTSAGIQALTEAGVVLGSPKYIAPERLFEHTSTVASDLWSLGATLYHAVEGRPPYLRSSTTGVLRALADTEPDPTRQAGPLTPLLAGLLRRDPATRLGVHEVEAKLRKVAGVRRSKFDRNWWKPTWSRPALPEPAHEATAAERVAQAAPHQEPQPATPHEPQPATPHQTQPAASQDVQPAAPHETQPATPQVAMPLGRSVDEVEEAGRPWLRRRLSAAAAVITLLALLAAVAANTRGGNGGARQPVSSAAAVASVLPEEFGWWADPSGFRVAVPDGWRPDPLADGEVSFADPSGGTMLRISRWAGPAGDVVAGLLAQEQDIQVPAYRRLRIEALPGKTGAVWEYTFLNPDSVAMRGLRRVVASGAEAYLIEWRTARDAWHAALPQLTVVLSTFAA
ncbi:protein kinase domain-containing protein [Actinoplanes sp. CA-015351]|uniref:serine/threonine-protein kinase n=1 Tax=Actinoplanes sp. CA-015351 TaxID=3239897 RepID=UPI003D98F62E